MPFPRLVVPKPCLAFAFLWCSWLLRCCTITLANGWHSAHLPRALSPSLGASFQRWCHKVRGTDGVSLEICLLLWLNKWFLTQEGTIPSSLRDHRVSKEQTQQTLDKPVSAHIKCPGTTRWSKTSHPPTQNGFTQYCLPGFSFALTPTLNCPWGFWNHAGLYMPNSDWEPILGNQPFLALLNRGGVES